MRKSIVLAAGFLAVALAGSAQAATMFAVQNASSQDQATIADTGTFNTNGNVTTNWVKDASGNVLTGWVGVGTSTPGAAIHVNGSVVRQTDASFMYTITNSGALSALIAPNFSFMRNNDPLATGTKNPTDPSFLRAGDVLGIMNFGTVYGGSNRNLVVMGTKSETDATATSRTGYWYLSTSHDNAGTSVLTEKMKLSSKGYLGLGLGQNPVTSKLQVVGLPAYNDNTAATTAGLTAGAFYLCGPAATGGAAQHLCIVY